MEISGALLVRNGLLNIIGQALPLVVGMVSVPIILRGLGTERFGLLVFLWTVTGALTIFDLGLASAVTKFVAEALGRGDTRAVSQLVWTTVFGQVLVGLAISGIMALLTPLLVLHVLRVSSAMQIEAIVALRLAAFLLPLMFVTNSLRGTLEAAQRFDIAALAKAASSASSFLVPVMGVAAGWLLPPITLALLAARATLVIALLVGAVRVLSLTVPVSPLRGKDIGRLLGFGRWVMISGLASVMLTYGDRVIIGTLQPMADLAYYAVPAELIARLGLVAGSMAAVLFPAFSALSGNHDRERLALLFVRAIRLGLLITGPIFGLAAVLAPDLLKAWVGAGVAVHSTSVLQLLAVGAAFQVIGVVPMTLIHGIGSPEVAAKLHVVEAPLYVVALLWLVHAAGANGAAAAWSGRFVLETAILLWLSKRLPLFAGMDLRGPLQHVAVPVVVACVTWSIVYYWLPVPTTHRVVGIAIVLLVLIWWTWARTLHPGERAAVTRLLRL